MRELTAHEEELLFCRATAMTEGAFGRWAERRLGPMTDDELQDALRYEMGIEGGGTGPYLPDGTHMSFYHYKGAGLQIWGGHGDYNICGRKPRWSGASTIAMARKVYGIRTPEEFRERSLFDFGMSDGNIKTGSSSTTT